MIAMSKSCKLIAVFCLVLSTFALASSPSATAHDKIEPGSKVFIDNMNGFESDLAAAIVKKKVPLTVVGDKSQADFIISGSSSLQAASWAKTLFITPAPAAHASINVKSAKDGDLVFAYSVDKLGARHGQQSTAEACAKHLKDFIKQESK